MERTYISDINGLVHRDVMLLGRVLIRRDHGKLIFIDFYDETGTVQMVVLPANDEAHRIASTIRPEWVLKVMGVVNERPERMVRPDEVNGRVEIEIKEVVVLNEATTPPISLDTDGREIGEENRLAYRHIDLRRPRMQRNIRMRHKIIKLIRDLLEKDNFIEIETPILANPTEEGARDYIVPSRVERGKFYALPQSPQQFKQLLMASGFEKYFQIARCMRDEDLRGDRQPEFTQLDMEIAYPTREKVMGVTETLLKSIVTSLFPEKKIQSDPFPVMTYKEAIEKYGSDRPDLRTNKDDGNELAFCFVVDFPLFEETDTGKLTFSHNPFASPHPEDVEQLKRGTNLPTLRSMQYDIVLNGAEIGGGSIRNHKSDIQRAYLSALGHSDEVIERAFGHILAALDSGIPPHGGIAWGLDRLIATLLNEPNIREVIAFPKNGEGKDLMLHSPASVNPEQLAELGLSTLDS